MATNDSYKVKSQGSKAVSNKNPAVLHSNPKPTGKSTSPGGVPTDTLPESVDRNQGSNLG